MGDISDYYRNNDFNEMVGHSDSLASDIEHLPDYDEDRYGGEYYKDIWTKYQKGKLEWETKDNGNILIEKMDDNHVKNTLSFLKRKTTENYALNEWIDVFEAEIKKRNI